MMPADPDLIPTIIFPKLFHTQIIIPANAITFQRSTERKYF